MQNPNVDALVQEGVAAIKAGKRDDAKRALMRAVELDEHSEQGWLWLSACVDSPDEQQICLENVLAINPNNQKARKGLDVILQSQGKPPSRPAAPSAPSPSRPSMAQPDPFSGGFDSNPFAGTGFDSNPYGDSNDNDPVFGSSSSSSSVDWNRGSGPAAYGSGKDVNLPSSDEYDSWVSGLSLGGSGASANPFDSSPIGGSSAFGSVDFNFDNAPDPFGGSSSPSPFDMNAPIGGDSDPYGGSTGSTTSAFGGFDLDDNSAFGSSSPAFGSSSSAFDDGPFGSSTVEDETEFTDDPFANSTAFSTGASSFGFVPPKTSPSERSADDIFGGVPGSGFKEKQSGIMGGPSSVFGRASEFGNNTFGGVLDDDEQPAPRSTAGPGSGSFAFIDPTSPGGPVPTNQQAYFKSIPPEIQATSKKADARLIATVAVLSLLNLISLAFMMLNLTKR